MQRLTNLPSAFKRFAKIGGVVDFAVFETCRGSQEELIEAIGSALPRWADFDEAALRSIGGRPMRERRFFGDWYDMDSGALIKVGDWRTHEGVELRDPRLKTLDRVRIRSGGFCHPEPGSGGQFAFAFSTPPYSLGARPREVQQLFDDIRDVILPPTRASDILDWSSPDLVNVSRYFTSGMEWWGVFLFTIHVPALDRLTVAMASTTD